MLAQTYFKTALVLTFMGVLFAGYLSAQKLITNQCAFNESCPYFLGFPACYYGFGIFLLMFIISVMALLQIEKAGIYKSIILVVSLFGLIFAGQWALPELQVLLTSSQKVSYVLGLSSCVYGFFFYLVILILSVFNLTDENLLNKY